VPATPAHDAISAHNVHNGDLAKAESTCPSRQDQSLTWDHPSRNSGAFDKCLTGRPPIPLIGIGARVCLMESTVRSVSGNSAEQLKGLRVGLQGRGATSLLGYPLHHRGRGAGDPIGHPLHHLYRGGVTHPALPEGPPSSPQGCPHPRGSSEASGPTFATPLMGRRGAHE